MLITNAAADYHYYWFSPIILLPSVALFIMSLMMKFQSVGERLLEMPQEHENRELVVRRLRHISAAIRVLYICAIVFTIAALVDVFIFYFDSRRLVITEMSIIGVSLVILIVGLCYSFADIAVLCKWCNRSIKAKAQVR